MAEKWHGWVRAIIEAMPTDRQTDAPATHVPAHLFKLWLWLARYGDNGTGEGWPSLATLARRYGCDRSHMARMLAEGEERGLWERERTIGGSRNNTTRYTVQRIPTSGAESTSGANATSGICAPKPVAQAQHRTKPRNKANTSACKRTRKPVTSKPKQPRQPDPVWDTVAALYFGGTVAEPHRTRCGKVVKQFTQLQADPDEIRRRHERMCAKWPDLTHTPEMLIKHWCAFTRPVSDLDIPLAVPSEEDLGCA